MRSPAETIQIASECFCNMQYPPSARSIMPAERWGQSHKLQLIRTNPSGIKVLDRKLGRAENRQLSDSLPCPSSHPTPDLRRLQTSRGACGAPMQKALAMAARAFVLLKNRGDKTAIELFIAGIRGWEAGLRRRLENGKSSSSS